MSSFKLFDIAGSGMAAQSVRLNTVASNLANAESASATPEGAYKARHPVFEAVKGLGARLREKSGLDEDGRPLVQAALGGKAPRVLLTACTTVTERNEQQVSRSWLKESSPRSGTQPLTNHGWSGRCPSRTRSTCWEPCR